MGLCKFLCAIITRALFILISLTGVWRVTKVKKDPNYWFLTLLLLPLVAEMVITLRRRKGKDYKWFSPPIFLFLISIIPSIWFLELHYQQEKFSDLQCKKLDSWENLRRLITVNETQGNFTYQNYLKCGSGEVQTDIWGLLTALTLAVRTAIIWSQIQSPEGRAAVFTEDLFCHMLYELSMPMNENINQVCSNDWILALHQILLILLIVGKWLLPLGGGVTRDELSQLLLIFVGTAADILEFTSETLSDVKENSPQLVYIILAVWTWSMLQFPLHLSVVNNKQDDEGESGAQELSLLTKHRTDMWNIVEALFIQDGPFLVVRLTVMTYFEVFHQMLVFFAIKNFMVVILNFYRLAVICQDFRPSSSDSRGSRIPAL